MMRLKWKVCPYIGEGLKSRFTNDTYLFRLIKTCKQQHWLKWEREKFRMRTHQKTTNDSNYIWWNDQKFKTTS